MAAYYHRPRRQQAQVADTRGPQDRITDYLPDSVTYIFPNPSSSPPSPSQISQTSRITDLSDISISNSETDLYSPRCVDEDELPSLSQVPRHTLTSPLSLVGESSGDQDLSWELCFPSQKYSESPRIELPSTSLSRRRPTPDPYKLLFVSKKTNVSFRHPLYRKISHSKPLFLRDQQMEMKPNHNSRLSLPYLSFFSNILKIDKSTLDLLTSPVPPSESVLFVGLEEDQTLSCYNTAEISSTSHGVEKLIAQVAIESGSPNQIRRGILCLGSESLPNFPAIPLASLWTFITGVVVNGRKAFHLF